MTEYRGAISEIEDALKWSATMIKFHTKSTNCVTRNDGQMSGGAIYQDIGKALSKLKALQAAIPPNLAEEIEALEKYKGKTNSTVLHAAKILLESK